MSATQIRRAKWALGVLWIMVTAALFAPEGSRLVAFGRFLFWFMLVAHAAECVLYWKAIRATGKPLGGQIVHTILFGVVHYQAMRKGAAGP